MFILDSLMISGIRWALQTALTAAEAEMNDDTALREQLLEAEMRREMGEISDDEFREVEADLLARLRQIRERREGGSGPIAFGSGEPMESSPGTGFQIEATVSGDFYGDPAGAPHTTIVETTPVAGGLVQTEGERTIEVLDMEPGDPNPLSLGSAATAARSPRRAGRPHRTGAGALRRSRRPSRAPRTRGR